MADLSNLNNPSITELGIDESIEMLRQIRLSRRVPVRKVTKTTRKNIKTVPKINPNQASELLKILTGG